MHGPGVGLSGNTLGTSRCGPRAASRTSTGQSGGCGRTTGRTTYGHAYTYGFFAASRGNSAWQTCASNSRGMGLPRP